MLKRSDSVSGNIGYYSRRSSIPSPDVSSINGNNIHSDAARLEQELIQLRESTKQALQTSWDEVEMLQSENSELKETIQTLQEDISKVKEDLSESKSREKGAKAKIEKLTKKLKSKHNSLSMIFSRRLSKEKAFQAGQNNTAGQVVPNPIFDDDSNGHKNYNIQQQQFSISSDLDPVSLLGATNNSSVHPLHDSGRDRQMKKSCSTPALKSLLPKSEGISSILSLKRLSLGAGGHSSVMGPKKDQKNFLNQTFHTMIRSPSSSSLLSYKNHPSKEERRSTISHLKRSPSSSSSLASSASQKNCGGKYLSSSMHLINHHHRNLHHSSSLEAEEGLVLKPRSRSSSKSSLMESSMHSCPEVRSARKVSFHDLVDVSLLEGAQRRGTLTSNRRDSRMVSTGRITGTKRKELSLHDIKSNFEVEESDFLNKEKPVVDEKDLLIRALQMKLMSRDQTINCMERTMLENIKNMQELHLSQHGSQTS